MILHGFPASQYILQIKVLTDFILGHLFKDVYVAKGLPRWFSGKEPTVNAGDVGLITGSGRSSGEENDSPLQCSCLENSMDRGSWWAAVCGVPNSKIGLSDSTPPHTMHTPSWQGALKTDIRSRFRAKTR